MLYVVMALYPLVTDYSIIAVLDSKDKLDKLIEEIGLGSGSASDIKVHEVKLNNVYLSEGLIYTWKRHVER